MPSQKQNTSSRNHLHNVKNKGLVLSHFRAAVDFNFCFVQDCIYVYIYIYIYMLYSRSFPTPLYLLDKHKLLCCSCIRILVRMVFERELVKGLPDPKRIEEKMPLKPVWLSLKCCTSLPSFSKVDSKKVLHVFFLVKCLPFLKIGRKIPKWKDRLPTIHVSGTMLILGSVLYCLRNETTQTRVYFCCWNRQCQAKFLDLRGGRCSTYLQNFIWIKFWYLGIKSNHMARWRLLSILYIYIYIHIFHIRSFVKDGFYIRDQKLLKFEGKKIKQHTRFGGYYVDVYMASGITETIGSYQLCLFVVSLNTHRMFGARTGHWWPALAVPSSEQTSSFRPSMWID